MSRTRRDALSAGTYTPPTRATTPPSRPNNSPEVSLTQEQKNSYQTMIDGFIQPNKTKLTTPELLGARRRAFDGQYNPTAKDTTPEVQKFNEEIRERAKNFESNVFEKFPDGLNSKNFNEIVDYIKDFSKQNTAALQSFLSNHYQWPEGISAEDKQSCIDDFCVGYIFKINTEINTQNVQRLINAGEEKKAEQLKVMSGLSGSVIRQKNKYKATFNAYLDNTTSEIISQEIFKEFVNVPPLIGLQGKIYVSLKEKELMQQGNTQGLVELKKQLETEVKANKLDSFKSVVSSKNWEGIAKSMLNKTKIPKGIELMQNIVNQNQQDSTLATKIKKWEALEKVANAKIIEIEKSHKTGAMFSHSGMQTKDPLTERFYYLVADKKHPHAGQVADYPANDSLDKLRGDLKAKSEAKLGMQPKKPSF